MIQRIQSLWLLLAAVCAFLTLQFSFYSGNILINEQLVLQKLTTLGVSTIQDNGTTTYNIISLSLAIIAGVIAFIVIFMYSNRKMQMRLTGIALLLSLLELVYMFILTKDFSDGTFSLTSVFVFLVPIFLFLALRAISKDEKLIKSMDRLR